MIWDSSVGKKTVMAVSGLLMLLYLIAHMYGNLKIFFGPGTFDEYAHWLRTVGEPFMHYEWTLWVIRVVLVIAVVAHAVSAYQLSRRDQKARPVKYAHPRRRASYATHTMRYGGIVLALFIVWHILDLTTGTVHSGGFQNGHPYANVVDTFSTWYGNVIYIVAMLALGLHIQHGFYSAAQTLGVGSRSRDLVLKTLANVLAVVITLGFIAVPVGVMTGLVD
ncbi:succinate dehydrogenase subunit C [Streptomyces sp. LcepLS]|nr:putative cytochrome B subunit [Streptomyces sp. Tu6071]SCD33308.1 succinate dehydrogenase subunit C [Streptomyces sp. TverLS-915]SCE27833.1 succinate dehydrogenase subunit C [Streptomyces sp. SolWspMP-sol7th]SCE38575.1 succinate dehydrogenase subunit C [Streptomyces sp. DfronAA-171]SCF46661.1 succinate dehydrogenase subunit C [Streptomyces sp. LcepLS]